MGSIDLATWAQVASAAGVIGSLIFVGLQIRHTNTQAGLENVRGQLDALRDFKSQTNDPFMAELVFRGRQSYHDLSDSEKLAFSLYLEQGIHAAMLIYFHAGKDNISSDESEQSNRLHIVSILDHPGTREWWAEHQTTSPIVDVAKERINYCLKNEAAGKSGKTPV